MSLNQKYYYILGIQPTSDKNLIKKAYRKKAFQYHPDTNPSPDAQSKFIELTDAYEIVMGFKQSHNTKNQANQSQQPTKEERVQRAKERYQKAKQKELEEEARYYLNMVQGKKWKFIKHFSLISALLGVLLFIDYVIPASLNISYITKTYKADQHNNKKVDIEGSTYFFKLDDALVIQQHPSIDLYKTPIFNDIKYIEVLNYKGRLVTIEPIFSFLSLFPLISIILLIPLFTYWYKRPSPLFSFTYKISIYFAPIVFCFALFSNWRIIQIFM